MKTEADVRKEVEDIITNAGVTGAMFGVKAMESGSSMWSRGKPTGMFQIDLWGLRINRHNSRDRSHMFRTKKDGTVPVDKITEFVERFVAAQKAGDEALKKKENATKSTADIHAAVVEHAKTLFPRRYWSTDWRNKDGDFITNDTSVDGKLAVNVGTMYLTGTQAVALLDLLASFK